MYANFIADCHPCILKLIDNMQVLHECQDSRDDHFTKRNIECRTEARRAAQNRNGPRNRDHDEDNALDEDEILSHLKKIDDCWSEKQSRSSDTVIDCLKNARESGLISDDRLPDVIPDTASLTHHHLRSDDGQMEKLWEQEYVRRKQWNHTIPDSSMNGSERHFSHPTSEMLRVDILSNTNLGENDSVLNSEAPDNFCGLPDATTSVQQPIPSSSMQSIISLDPDIVANSWNLNTKQKVAYRLIVDRSLSDYPDPLSLIITGAAGTGKSRIIHAAQHFLAKKNQSYRFRLASFTGIAAQNIEGVTIHSALALSAFRGEKMPPNTAATLIKRWADVDFLFIDEYSMIGCQMLYKIHLALTIAKECSKPFGGINVIFAGDFAQLPAVGDTRLYTKFGDKRSTGNEKAHTTAMYGKLLWLSIRNIVILQSVERQRGTGAEALISLLDRLRMGKCTNEDYNFLCGRLANRLKSSQNIYNWKNAPIIVSENATKDALNMSAAEAFARETGRHLFWYYCTDTHDGQTIVDPNLRNHLLSMSSNNTAHRLGRLPLVIGMPVMIMTNFDVSNGVVNGRTGTLKSVNYWVDEYGFRHATSCVVESEGIVGPVLPGLAEKQVVALQDEVEMMFVHPHSKKRCKIKRTQLPIQPAFAITAYKSQSLSLDRVVVDLESCSGTEAPYVMVSRVKSLDGLLILRPFRQLKISCHMSEDVRDELKRQKLLELSTLARHGAGVLAQAAIKELEELNFHELLEPTDCELDLAHSNLDTLLRHENHIGQQLEVMAPDSVTSSRKRPVSSPSSRPGKRSRLTGKHLYT